MTTLRELTADEVTCLAGIIAKLRPHGARRWDPAGIRAKLMDVAEIDAAEVIKAAVRLAQDREALTPGQIAKPESGCWRERLRELPPPPNQRRYCPTHAVMLDANGVCRSCRADQLVGDETTPPGERLPADAAHSVVDELRDHARGGSDA
jgi:hypothetical protein